MSSSSQKQRRSSKQVNQMELLNETWKECGEIEQVVSDLPALIVVESLKKPVYFPYVVSLKEEYIELSDKEKESPPVPVTTVFVLVDKQEPFDVKGFQLRGAMNTVHFSCAVMRFVNCYKTLTELRLINCSLVAESIFMLSASLKDTRVTHLYLDENVIKDENHHVILTENLTLVHLSLRLCRITDMGAKKLAEELKYCNPSHQHLKSLNLNGNLIGDEGLCAIATALRWNRNLVSLNIAGNCIRDKGGKALASVLTPFELNDVEMKLRGERMCERLLKIKDFIDSHAKEPWPPMEKKSSVTSPALGNKKSPSQSRRASKVSRESSIQVNAPNKGTYNEALAHYYELERRATGEIPEDANPLITDVRELEKGRYSSQGNSSLWYINISYNRLTVESLQDFMNAVKYQIGNVVDFDKGMVRFEFEGNQFEENEPTIEELRKLFSPFKSKISVHEPDLI